MYIGEIIKPSNGSLINDSYYTTVVTYILSAKDTVHIQYMCNPSYTSYMSLLRTSYIYCFVYLLTSILYSNIYLYLVGPDRHYELYHSYIVSYTCYSSFYISTYVIIYWVFSYITMYFLVILYRIRVTLHFIFHPFHWVNVSFLTV